MKRITTISAGLLVAALGLAGCAAQSVNNQ